MESQIQFKTVVIDGAIFVFGVDREHFSVGCAEASRLNEDNKNLYFFNRLYVKPKYRGHNYSNELLKRFVEEADKNKIDIQLIINAYGELDYDELKNLYIKYNFEETKEGLFIRKHRGEP